MGHHGHGKHKNYQQYQHHIHQRRHVNFTHCFILIIFMLAVPVMTHTVRVELPQAGDHRNDIEPQVIHLTVTEEGKIEWENEAVSHHLLQSRLQAAAQQQPQPAVHLSGDRNVAYEHVVKVMATVEQAGLYKLGFLTQIE
jgi:biopolymer transport protein ExbD